MITSRSASQIRHSPVSSRTCEGVGGPLGESAVDIAVGVKQLLNTEEVRLGSARCCNSEFCGAAVGSGGAPGPADNHGAAEQLPGCGDVPQ